MRDTATDTHRCGQSSLNEQKSSCMSNMNEGNQQMSAWNHQLLVGRCCYMDALPLHTYQISVQSSIGLAYSPKCNRESNFLDHRKLAYASVLGANVELYELHKICRLQYMPIVG